MEESLEIYQLRLEHKRFLEDAEQERASLSKEDMRAKLVAEMELRAGVERSNRQLKNENMELKLKLEKFERLERAGGGVEVRALGPPKTPSPKKTEDMGENMDVIEILDSDDDDKMVLDTTPSPKKPRISNLPQSTPNRKHHEGDAENFDVAMGHHSEHKVTTNRKSTSTKLDDGKERVIKLKPESPTKMPMEAMSSTTKKRGLPGPGDVKEVKKPKIQSDTAPPPPRDKGKRKEVVEDSSSRNSPPSSRNSPPSSFLDSAGEMDGSATSSSDMGAYDAEETRQQTKSRSVPPLKANPRKGGSGKQPMQGTLRSKAVSTSINVAGSETPPAPKKPKGEGEPFVLNPEKAAQVLRGLPSLAIEPPALQLKLPWKFLTNTFGLPIMGFLWDTHENEEKKIPGRDFRFIMATYQLNPNMPSYPGGSGLLLSSREGMVGHAWSLFSVVRGGKAARWNYLGEYRPKKVGAMSAEDFKNQSFKVRKKWGDKIAAHKKYPEYRDMRARITLRKRHGKEPDAKAVEVESEKIKKKAYKSDLSGQDVIDAFDRGEESINIFVMECESYNEGFAQELATKLVPWTETDEEKKKVKGASKKGKSKGGREGAEEEDEESDEPQKKSEGKRSAVNDKTKQGASEVATRKRPIRTLTRPVVAAPSVEEEGGSESDIGSDSDPLSYWESD